MMDLMEVDMLVLKIVHEPYCKKNLIFAFQKVARELHLSSLLFEDWLVDYLNLKWMRYIPGCSLSNSNSGLGHYMSGGVIQEAGIS
ncbi:hypothetical protein CMV_028559 [Castanea mollissima]|uniref:Uncharacterized protein n=1 Tax=Castanea mollissima TaxID=60419 RepID=A0A8J4QES0_9ROSI|nr:hypothetical protein CMV_028559 [Castanea mollissima]